MSFFFSAFSPLSSASSSRKSSATRDALILTSGAGILAAFLLCVLIPGKEQAAEDTPHFRQPVILTEEQEQHPPTLPRLGWRKSLVHKARTLVPRPRRASAPLPLPVDPKGLETAAIPVMVDIPPSALPLPKGPAPQVSKTTTRKRARSLDAAVCPGW
ncbi:hypothetical protein B0H17DRAFT_1127310 [Mycena rosella]|uniref:Uncharacterized protein n=1 Tax=Mycena rosella TaxID=1033263 RepID=A0AAD7GRJ6_MYCRO|nr:hypothetical protein B0H17DRAFT_1127310 [Mycena rosella]